MSNLTCQQIILSLTVTLEHHAHYIGGTHPTICLLVCMYLHARKHTMQKEWELFENTYDNCRFQTHTIHTETQTHTHIDRHTNTHTVFRSWQSDSPSKLTMWRCEKVFINSVSSANFCLSSGSVLDSVFTATGMLPLYPAIP